MHDRRQARAALRLAVLEVQCSKNVERFERYAMTKQPNYWLQKSVRIRKKKPFDGCQLLLEENLQEN